MPLFQVEYKTCIYIYKQETIFKAVDCIVIKYNTIDDDMFVVYCLRVNIKKYR
jgi:hypothetical protein